MGIPNSVDFANKWAQAMGSSSQAYKDGVNSVTQSPMEAAANNVQGYLNGVQNAVNTGKFQAGLRRVSLQDWKTLALNLGATRLSAGAAAAKPKMQKFADAFLPFLAAGVAQIKSMPAATIDDRINRAVAMMRYNATFKR